MVLWLAGALTVGKIDLENATDAFWIVFFIGFLITLIPLQERP